MQLARDNNSVLPFTSVSSTLTAKLQNAVHIARKRASLYTIKLRYAISMR